MALVRASWTIRNADRSRAGGIDRCELSFEHVTSDWHDVTTEDEAFFTRVYGPGEFKFHGADLGILVTKGRMQTAEG